MATQTTYAATIPAGPVGFVSNMQHAVFITRNVEDVAGVAFGKPVSQSVADKGCKAFAANDTTSKFLGITALTRDATGDDKFVQRESARIMTKGPMRVLAAVQVAAGDPVAVTSAGEFSNAAGTGGLVIPGARWDESTTGTNQVAQITIK